MLVFISRLVYFGPHPWMILYRFEQRSVDVEKASQTNLRGVHLCGSQEHVHLSLSVCVHPGELNHQQLLLEIGSYLHKNINRYGRNHKLFQTYHF